MLLESLGQMLQNYLSIELWLIMILGVIIGLIFGIIPGLTGMVAIALLLPFIFMMTPERALPLLMSITAVQFMGGSMTAILLSIPGTPPNAATVIDGHTMAQKGEAGRAIGAALASSAAGSIVTPLIALAMIPLVLPMIMAIHTTDMVFIILMGVIFIGVLAGGSMIKGLISGATGMLISLIGHQSLTGVERFTFGILHLYEGFAIIPVALGLFAIPEMVTLAAKGGTIAKTKVKFHGLEALWSGAKDVIRHWALFLQSSIIGFISGLIPGVGASVATFIAYGHAKQISKHPDKFGTGIVEGVIAPESANDSKEAGALLTTLALGIPGSAVMALILAALIMLGIIPGPDMLTTRLPLSLTLMSVILVASVIGAVICFILGPYLSRVAFIPTRLLVPVILAVVMCGAFVFRGLTFDIIVLLVFGSIGLAMKMYGYNRPALLLGFILGGLFEKWFFLGLKLGGPLFFLSPLSLALIAIIIVSIVYRPLFSWFRRRKGAEKR